MSTESDTFERVIAKDRKAERRLVNCEIAVMAVVIALALWRLHAGA